MARCLSSLKVASCRHTQSRSQLCQMCVSKKDEEQRSRYLILYRWGTGNSREEEDHSLLCRVKHLSPEKPFLQDYLVSVEALSSGELRKLKKDAVTVQLYCTEVQDTDVWECNTNPDTRQGGHGSREEEG